MEFLIVVGVLGLLAFYAVTIYNKLVSKRTLVDEGFSGVDVQLKRRADLIPNLIETVKGYMEHEKSTLERVTELRSQAQSATNVDDRMKAEAGISRVLGNIMVLTENYPALQASSSFVSLQAELSSIEDQLQMARRYYNGAVRDLNMLVEQFPSNIIASKFQFTTRAFFEIENEADREVQKVSFK